MKLKPKFTIVIVWIFIIFFSRLSVVYAGKLSFSYFEKSANAKLAELILKEAYDKLQIEIESIGMPGQRALLYANEGKSDGELQRVSTINRKFPNLVRVPETLFAIEIMVFTKDLIFILEGPESLRPYQIGVLRGAKMAESIVKGMQVTKVDSVDQLFQLLESKRVDLFILGRLNGLRYKKDTGIKNITVLEPPLVSKPLYHFLHKKNSHLVPKINSILKEMRTAGDIEKIVDEFIQDLSVSNK